MSTDIKEAETMALAPSPAERELAEWVEDSQRRRITTANDGLRQLVTLTTALLGGSAALLGQAPLSLWSKAIGMGLLIFALIAALFGSLPRQECINRVIEEARELREKIVQRKLWWLYCSAALLVLAFITFLLGLIATAF